MLPRNGQFCATQNQSTPLFVNGKPKPVAFYAPKTKTLQKGIDFARHLVQKPKVGIAFDAEILTQAETLGATQISVRDLTTDDVWAIAFAEFRRFQFVVNRGFGAQFAVELGRWSRNGEPAELAKREQLQAAKVSQFSLFDAKTDYMGVYR